MKKKKFLILLLVLAVLIVGLLLLENNKQEVQTPENGDLPSQVIDLPNGEENGAVDIAMSCELAGGNWLEDFSECEYVEADWCLENNGVFSECESACRHDEEAEICTMQCVPVCQIL